MITFNQNSSQDSNLQYQFNSLDYSIRPINLSDLSHLRCIISITNKNGYQYLDRLDLYNAGARRMFINKARPKMETDAVLMEKHLLEIINILEKERDTNNEQRDTALEIPPESRKEALEYLKSPDLIDLVITDYKSCGYVGEEKNFLTGYMVAISRKLSKPLGMIIISRSGAGKSTLQQAIISFVPPEDCLNYTRITNTAFFYKDRYSLKHKLISIDEEKGLSGANYAVRSLLNGEGLLSSATIKDPVTGNMKAKDRIVEGPSGLLIGTTETEMDYETLSRFIIITVDESMEQTRRILEKQREQDTLEGIIKTRLREQILQRHHNIQRLLQPLTVINNIKNTTMNIPEDRLIMRRGNMQYHKLIKSVALLHQHQREIKNSADQIGEFQYIEVTQKDIEIADYLSKDIIKRTYDELSPVTRQFLTELKKLKESRRDKNGDSNKITRRDIREYTKWNDYQIRQSLNELEKMEYIIKTNGWQGKLCTYELIYDGSDSENKIIPTSLSVLDNDIEREICQTLRKKRELCVNFAD